VSGDFRVAVSKDYLVFASAHFITFRGHQCETLHGHNYRVGVAVEGNVQEESRFVVDFSILKKVVRRLTDELDHKVLLPLQNPKLTYREEGARRHVDYFGVWTYTFPIVDCAMVAIENTTAEMLAQHFAGRTREALHALGVTHLRAIELEVEESFGQAATFRLETAVKGKE
jgi:6-pyruvoyltetrahydropterin/6-carboxytetrahydropterin synthase